MDKPYLVCPSCLRPILFDEPGVLRQGGMAHLKCRDLPGSVNAWPEGIRHLLCLRCGRAFESDSKTLRLCKVCRSRSDWRL